MKKQIWKVNDELSIELINIKDYMDVPDGVELFDIFGKSYVKGKDYIDDDTRGGYMAYGFKVEPTIS